MHGLSLSKDIESSREIETGNNWNGEIMNWQPYDYHKKGSNFCKTCSYVPFKS